MPLFLFFVIRIIIVELANKFVNHTAGNGKVQCIFRILNGIINVIKFSNCTEILFFPRLVSLLHGLDPAEAGDTCVTVSN